MRFVLSESDEAGVSETMCGGGDKLLLEKEVACGGARCFPLAVLVEDLAAFLERGAFTTGGLRRGSSERASSMRSFFG